MGIRHLDIDGRWELLEFAQLVRLYAQVYSFFYALHARLEREGPNPRIIQMFHDYPRIDSWSSSAFYDLLYGNTPEHCRPVPKSI